MINKILDIMAKKIVDEMERRSSNDSVDVSVNSTESVSTERFNPIEVPGYGPIIRCEIRDRELYAIRAEKTDNGYIDVEWRATVDGWKRVKTVGMVVRQWP